MKKQKSNYDDYRENLLKKSGAREYYDALQPEAEMLKTIIDERCKQKLTQQDISDITGIDRADISKIENGNGNPTLKTLRKLAAALNCKLIINIVPIK